MLSHQERPRGSTLKPAIRSSLRLRADEDFSKVCERFQADPTTLEDNFSEAHSQQRCSGRGLAQRLWSVSEPASLFFQMLELLPAGLLQPPTASAQPAAAAALNLETLKNSEERKSRSEDGTQTQSGLRCTYGGLLPTLASLLSCQIQLLKESD